MNDDEILEILRENSDEEYVFDFLKELFSLEIADVPNKSKTYGIIIDEYINKI